MKELVTKGYQNVKFQQPYQQAMCYRSLILHDNTWPWMDGLEVIPHLEADDLAKFVPMLLSRAFLECYIAGNIEPKEAESMIHHIEDIFYSGPRPICRPLFPSQYLTNRVIKLDRGMSYFYPAEGLNPSDENSALVHYIQVQDSPKGNDCVIGGGEHGCHKIEKKGGVLGKKLKSLEEKLKS
ncbi:Insulin-degrading enzyme-like 1, peroxisomal [Vitis vinifera]|uniref:Insulin-degrading enzyme-like 1, peroxisomal n=1 Tax=Vitis vinifera TaxID=29760 RepID=A0A438C053_VITVI|nr:Insulin-degrading enzyme-like 1, peroxisomal [Vitis vinifera]